MKRLLCIVGSMNAGGAETFLMKIYRQLDREKYQLDFAVATDEEGFYDSEIINLGGKIFHIPPKSKGLLNNFLIVCKLVRKEKYNYVLRTSQHSLSALELLAAKLGGAKVRVYRSSNSNVNSNSKIELLIHKFFLFMPKYFANVKLAPSTEAAEFMFGKKGIKSGKVSLMNNAIDISKFTFNRAKREDIRDYYNLENNILIGHIGRFEIQKNHLFLLEIFYNLLKIIPYSKLMLVGDGELKDDIYNRAKELDICSNIIFTGIRSDIPQLLMAMDLYLFPSLYEGMPNTVIEAQATGLPCLVSESITKEVNITGLVDFYSLDKSALDWAKNISEVVYLERTNTKRLFLEKHYDVKSSTRDFIEKIFEVVL